MKKKATLQLGKHNIGRFHFLLLTFVLIIFFRPFLDVLILNDIWVNLCTDIFLYLALMSGLYAMSDQTVQLRVSWVLIGIVMILGLLQHFLHSPGVEKIRLALTVVYLIQIMVMIWTYIEKEKKKSSFSLFSLFFPLSLFRRGGRGWLRSSLAFTRQHPSTSSS